MVVASGGGGSCGGDGSCGCAGFGGSAPSGNDSEGGYRWLSEWCYWWLQWF